MAVAQANTDFATSNESIRLAVSRDTSTMWQVTVLTNTQDAQTPNSFPSQAYRRYDSADAWVREPKSIESWTMEVGWHRRLTELSTLQQDIQLHESSREHSVSSSQAAVEPTIRIVRERDTRPRRSQAREARFAELLAEAAHDIRSPIAVAQQIVRTISEQASMSGSLSPGEIELLDIANTRLVQANKWAEGILIGRSLEHGEPVNIRHRFYPSQWRATIEPLLLAVAARRRVELQWRGWDRSLPRLYLDENQLSRAVLNLVTNAVQASDFGSHVAIDIAVSNNHTPRMVFTIEDRGVGMPDDLIQRLNSPMKWSVADEESNSSGIGLRTSRALIRCIGGEIHASRLSQGGTQVRFTLPIDSPSSLMRSWLYQNAGQGKSQGIPEPLEIQLHAVRAKQMDLCFANTQLQQSAGAADFVYRVADDRWLWLTLASASEGKTESNLQAAIRRMKDVLVTKQPQACCFAKMVYRLCGVELPALFGNAGSTERLVEVTDLLAHQFSKLTAGRVPPIDDIHVETGSIVFRSRNSGQTRLIRQDMPQPRALPKLSLSRSETPLAESPAAAGPQLNPDNSSRAIAEVSQLLRRDQAALGGAHARLTGPKLPLAPAQ